ncbi:hypothetical protein GCK72_019726 [Caenorhabditis remanei]|uniref:C-type lectin domain-containing protein n=1 Tax=Caenorhabditis remanei TaxID=31234 RepID=A0A6A5GDM4_CAERE|nr:hypothetical protein GCK72_019726 [Caenorhabditis remanei]KAF1753170.1 hypothetical protein GCK72_019726 [Caenorhabditis remanei]
MNTFVLAVLFITAATAIYIGEGGGGGRGGSSSSSSWSSEEGGRGGGRGRPHRPRPPGRPPGRPHRPPRPPRPPPRPAREECPTGWHRFERPNGVWCILVGNPGITNGYFSHQEAETACARQGATLTGFQNDNERMTIANDALRKVQAVGRTVGGLWLGATNNAGCAVASCGPFNTFRWTDGHTTGNGGFKWGVGEPDNLNWGATSCIQQFIVAPNFVAGRDDWAVWKTSFQHGDLDKYRCGVQAKPVTRLYACGKRGVRR